MDEAQQHVSGRTKECEAHGPHQDFAGEDSESHLRLLKTHYHLYLRVGLYIGSILLEPIWFIFYKIVLKINS